MRYGKSELAAKYVYCIGECLSMFDLHLTETGFEKNSFTNVTEAKVRLKVSIILTDTEERRLSCII
jgi:hypothetical protein